jgi:hypothetical protein
LRANSHIFTALRLSMYCLGVGWNSGDVCSLHPETAPIISSRSCPADCPSTGSGLRLCHKQRLD